MPTADRRSFVKLALYYFLRQDYPNRELIIVDDGMDPVEDLIPADPRIHYHRLTVRKKIGTKRNIACQLAQSNIIAHWDDDDWVAARRLNYQVTQLQKSQASICGLDKLYYYRPKTNQAWQFVYPKGEKFWLAGNVLCYKKSFWERHPFLDIDIGEDLQFVRSARVHEILPLSDSSFIVGIIHAHNSSPKHPNSDRWQPKPLAIISNIMGSDFRLYQQSVVG